MNQQGTAAGIIFPPSALGAVTIHRSLSHASEPTPRTLHSASKGRLKQLGGTSACHTRPQGAMAVTGMKTLVVSSARPTSSRPGRKSTPQARGSCARGEPPGNLYPAMPPTRPAKISEKTCVRWRYLMQRTAILEYAPVPIGGRLSAAYAGLCCRNWRHSRRTAPLPPLQRRRTRPMSQTYRLGDSATAAPPRHLAAWHTPSEAGIVRAAPLKPSEQ